MTLMRMLLGKRISLVCLWLLVVMPAWGQQTNAAPALRLANLALYGHVEMVDSLQAQKRQEADDLLTERGGKVALTPSKFVIVEWNEPRDVRGVDLRFADQAAMPEDITVEWWHHAWPDTGTGGWVRLDDPYNGKWIAAHMTGQSGPQGMRLIVQPLDINEAPGIENSGAEFRRTCKLRVSSVLPATLTHLHVFSDAVLTNAQLRFEWDLKTKTPGSWSPEFEARNGRILKAQRGVRNTAVVDVEYARSGDRLSNDRGQVILRSGERSFSVFVDDVMREGGLYVRDLGVFVSNAARGWTYATWPGPQGDRWTNGTVMEQVGRLPEQSYAHVMQTMPPKPSRHGFLGVPNVRQEIAVSYNGDIELHADSLRSPGPDADRRPWTCPVLTLHLGDGQEPVFGWQNPRQTVCSLEGGWLPVIRHVWTNGPITYTETCLATTLTNDLAGFKSTDGTEPIVLSARVELANASSSTQTGWLWIKPSEDQPFYLGVDGTMVLSAPSDGVSRNGMLAVRGRIDTLGQGDLDLVQTGGTNAFQAVRYRIELKPGEKHAIELAIPYVELLDLNELAALKKVSFTQAHDAVVQFWTQRANQGMTLDVPDALLNNLFKANLWHVLISTDLEPTTGQAQHGAATHQYLNLLNETMMVARSLDMRGEFAEARALIDTFLANQGVKGLPGNFQTKDGVLYAAHPENPDPYTAQGYNMHHGFGLWGAAEHYLFSRDQAYLTNAADKLVKGCDWIVNERKATQIKLPRGARPMEYGLPPAGNLKDTDDYLYYYATAAYYYRGMRDAASVLKTFKHPQASRLQREAEAFRTDIEASITEATATAPVVRLRDGTWIPYVPGRAYARTHLKEGWIREGLYPALHLVSAGVLPPKHPATEWMIQELEDNVFLSAECGYGLKDPQASFFNLGGFTLQPNLLDLGLVYLMRDQPEHFLRVFYNTAGASLYPDLMCFAEWLPMLGQGDGPLYKTPDECKFIQMLRQMLILENGDTLELGLGVPRAWMAGNQHVAVSHAATHFGMLDMEITPVAGQDQIKAHVQLSRTAFPKEINLRLRHASGHVLRSATVNGKPARVNATRQTIELPANASRWDIVGQF